jgi:hypothetical protein
VVDIKKTTILVGKNKNQVNYGNIPQVKRKISDGLIEN